MKYKSKPTIKEAIQFDGTTRSVYEMICLWPDSFFDKHSFDGSNLIIHTLEGEHTASVGDYVIRGISGEFYPCKPDIFEKSYERVE